MAKIKILVEIRWPDEYGGCHSCPIAVIHNGLICPLNKENVTIATGRTRACLAAERNLTKRDESFSDM